MTKDELQAIKERAEKATSGPWFDDERETISRHDPLMREDEEIAWSKYIRDIPFIAHARQDIPALLAEVEWLRTKVTELEYDIAVMRGEINDFEGVEG